jgi:1-acyl-sn-glycerol-3-phosphate acyltransferase
MGTVFWVVRQLNPHIVVFIDESELSLQSGIPPRSVLLSNHTSFMDSLLIPSILPHKINFRIRTLYKHTLGQVPVFGPIMHRTGNFPVYFTRNESKSFTVDQAKQAVVTDMVEAHLVDDHGVLLLYPEGRINENPKQLLSFRRGTFKIVLEHKPTAVGMVIVGDNVSWPHDSPIGGFPADIFVKFFPIELDYDSNRELLQISESARVLMQMHLTDLLGKVGRKTPGETLPLRGSFAAPAVRL